MSNMSTWGSDYGRGGVVLGSRSTSMPRRNDNPYTSASMSRAWMTPRGPNPFADGASLSKPPPSILAVSPRLGTLPAHCISLVTTSQASEHSPGEVQEPLLPPRGCHQLLVSQELACLPGPTGSVTREALVQPGRLSPASGAVAGGSGPAAVSASASAASILASGGSMCSSGGAPLLEESVLQSLLKVAWPRLGSNRFHMAPVSTHLRPQRIYELRVSYVSRNIADSAHDMLVLVLSPPSMLRLLRSEQWIVKSEAVVVKWIRSVLLAGGSTIAAHVELESSNAQSGCSSLQVTQRAPIQDDFLFKDMDLSEILPALIDHSQSAKDIGTAYNILSHLTGLLLSSFADVLTTSQRSHVDFQAGRLVRRLSQLPSPSGKFGPAISVLCPTAVAQSKAGGSMSNPGGMDSWSLAFHAMLEGILRDAEDMAVTVPYQAIRRHFRRLGHHLDEVTVPRLVIIDAAHDSNIMAERIGIPPEGARIVHKTALQDLLEDSDGSDGSDTEDRKGGREAAPDIRITGLRDWSNCIFADPLMAVVFNDKPSRDFLRGFDGRPRRRRGHDSSDSEGRDRHMADDDPIELHGETHIRLLLYQCYHATVAVVKEFYRPHSDSTSRELAARKRLNAVLARLNEVGASSKRNHVRPSSEAIPSKKPKTEDRRSALGIGS